MSDVRVAPLDAAVIDRRMAELVALLDDAVAGGASVGFVLPLAAGELEAFWREVGLDVEDGMRMLWVAEEGERIVGSVQLVPSPKSNQRHRADVQKFLVHREARRRGIGAALMTELENCARVAGRVLLTLDTRESGAAELLYRREGWTAAGHIPNYAVDPDRCLAGCVFFYKQLGPL